MSNTRIRAAFAAALAALAATLLAASPAAAEKIEFSCRRLYIRNPADILFQVDMASATVAVVSGDVQYRSTSPATITDSAIDWTDGHGADAQSHHLDRLSGHMTLLVPQPSGLTTVEFECHRTSGF